MAATGVNKQVLKNTYKKANSKLQDLNNKINTLNKQVLQMNQSIWYGGNSATKWYNAVSAAHTSNTKFHTKAQNLQASLKKQINRLDQSTNG